MTSGIIGAGARGTGVARLLAKAGGAATIANNRGPETLADLVAEPGPAITVATLAEAANADIVVIAVRWVDVERVLFYASDDAKAKAEVRAILDQTGFYPIDLGPLDVGGPLMSLPFGPLSSVTFIKA